MQLVSHEAFSEELLAAQNESRTVWIGAASFEDRCVGSLKEIAALSARLWKGVIVSYETDVRPSGEGRSKRAANLQAMKELADPLFTDGATPEYVEPYVFDDFLALVERHVQAGADCLLLDITCLTKLHTLAAAASLARDHRHLRVRVAYSIPENYGFLDDRLKGQSSWKDVIVAPLAETAELFNESNSRGIVVPGHEVHRLVVAIGEIEPAGGLILMAHLRGRPDLRHLAVRRNQRLLNELTRMASQRWERREVEVRELTGLSRHVSEVVKVARQKQAPVILFPFGPKSIIFGLAYQLSRDYPQAAWFVYPVPVAYDVNYSFGLEEVLWFAP